MSADSYYTGMASLQAISAKMDALSANLANTQTAGYQAVQAVAQAAPYAGANAPPGADVVALSPGPDLRPGALTHTGNPLTVGLGGDGWLEVQTASGTALTRNGTLQISAEGLLADGDGNPLLGADGNPISLPKLTSLTIGSDGAISGVPVGQPGQTTSYGQLALAATPAGAMRALSGSLFLPADPTQLQQSPAAKLSQGYLNGSNVDSVKSMVELIDVSRSYQMQTNLMKTSSDNSRALNTVLAQG
ncbi:flagellar hook-basal body complex protein [Acidisoma silvae]|uniref:Flagellar basal-body rod protein FlgF n=1 Tax=Acidisoma silvae TaxID=2802396 RepID=A0A964DY51_9PROT|nr:flagellar hook-basal body complex protein [Acidisoma silvae]MCB8874906.1 flagellar hook-basal body complex protein [Acidisoma silvae]